MIKEASSMVSSVPIIIEEVLHTEELLFLVYDYCDVLSRQKFLLLSKFHTQLLLSDASFQLRCQQLHREYGIYHPPTIPSSFPSWKALYFNNRKHKSIWADPNGNGNDDDNGNGNGKDNDNKENDYQFQITVCARFKPKERNIVGATIANNNNENENENENENDYKKRVTLPLHQRLELIKLNRHLESNKEALKVLTNQGEWFHKYSSREEDVKKEPRPSLSESIHFLDTKKHSAILIDRNKGLRKFQFDHVFGEHTTQKNVYDISTISLVTDFINGFNTTCIVYGQTGSGKTHTMFGPPSNNSNQPFIIPRCDDDDDDNEDNGNGNNNANHNTNNNSHLVLSESHGIVQKTCAQIFQAMEFRNKTKNNNNTHLNIESKLYVSYIEIYGSEVNDLLRDGKPCGHSRVSAHRYVLSGECEIFVESLKDVFQLLNVGEKQKRVAATNMNHRSSRSHTLFILTLRQSGGAIIGGGNGSTLKSRRNKESRLILADLGGSEQIKKSLLPCGEKTKQFNKEQRLRETININLGLLALKQCVKALRQRSYNSKYPKKPKIAIPYADSKLTMLLSSGLGGSSNNSNDDYTKTSIIICASQHEDHVHETIDALKFGQLCKGIKNDRGSRKSNNSTSNFMKEILSTINENIKECEINIKKYERWETRTQNVYDNRGSIIDTKQTTFIVGAEQWHQQLNDLLQQKMELTGDKIENHLYYYGNNNDLKNDTLLPSSASAATTGETTP